MKNANEIMWEVFKNNILILQIKDVHSIRCNKIPAVYLYPREMANCLSFSLWIH